MKSLKKKSGALSYFNFHPKKPFPLFIFKRNKEGIYSISSPVGPKSLGY